MKVIFLIAYLTFYFLINLHHYYSDNHYYRDKSAALDPKGSQMGYIRTFVVTFFFLFILSICKKNVNINLMIFLGLENGSFNLCSNNY